MKAERRRCLNFLKHSDDKVKKKFKYQLSMLVMENKILREPHVKHFIIERYRQFYEFRIKVSKKNLCVSYSVRGTIISYFFTLFTSTISATPKKALENALKVYESLESDSLLPFQYLKEVMLG